MTASGADRKRKDDLQGQMTYESSPIRSWSLFGKKYKNLKVNLNKGHKEIYKVVLKCYKHPKKLKSTTSLIQSFRCIY